ncbi:MAG: hypothetical protein WD751_00020 [Anaerolineales bacterium]
MDNRKRATARYAVVLLVSLALLLASCTPSSQDITGRWQADPDQLGPPPFIYELEEDGIGYLIWVPLTAPSLAKPLTYTYSAEAGILEIQPAGEAPQSFEFEFAGENEALLKYRGGPAVRFFRVAIPNGPVLARVALHNVISELDYEIFTATPVDDFQSEFPGYSVRFITSLSFVAGQQVESWLFLVKLADEPQMRSYLTMNAGSGWGVAELVLP